MHHTITLALIFSHFRDPHVSHAHPPHLAPPESTYWRHRGCRFETSKWRYSLRTEKLLRSIKKNHQLFLKTKKVRAKFGKFSRKNEISIFWKISWFFRNFWFFRKFSLKIPTKMFDLKNFRKNHENFRKIKNLIFFSKIFQTLL